MGGEPPAAAATFEKLLTLMNEPLTPSPWPPDDPEIREALARAAGDGSWGRYVGPHGPRLAEALAEMHGVEHVSLCCSGTFAVQLALRALRIGPGDEVLLAGYDFGGNFRAIEAGGATPVLIDVAAENSNLDPTGIEAACSPKTRAIVASHLHGGIVPMRELTAAAKARGLVVVEDACQTAGATVEGRPAGTWGDVGVLSFGGSKLLTAGRGGAIMTRHAEIHQRAKVFSDQGNNAYPLSELQAAVLLPQVTKLGERHARRRAAVARLKAALAGVAALKPLVNRSPNSDPAYYKLGFMYAAEAAGGRPREQFVAAAQAAGVAIDTGFRGFLHRGAKRCRRAGDLANCAAAAERMLVLHHPVLLEDDATIDCVAAVLIAAIETARVASERGERNG